MERSAIRGSLNADPSPGLRCAPSGLREFAMTAEIAGPPRTESHQLRLLRRNRIASTNGAAGDHLGIDAAIGVAEPALQRLRDGKIARGGIRIDIDGGAADDAFHHLEPDV